MQTLIVDTLKVWREAERVLGQLAPADPKHEFVRKLVIDLRSLYADLSEKQNISTDAVAQGRAKLDDAKQRLQALLSGA